MQAKKWKKQKEYSEISQTLFNQGGSKMGAHYLQMIIKTTEKKFYKFYEKIVEQERIEYGTDPYSGSWATIERVMIVNDPYPERKWTKKKYQDVSNWIADNTEKWECAKAVKTSKGYMVGGWASS